MALSSQTRIAVKHHILNTLYRYGERGTLKEIMITNYLTNACNKCSHPGDFFHILPSVVHPLLRNIFPIEIKNTISTGEFYKFKINNEKFAILLKEQFTVATLLRS